MSAAKQTKSNPVTDATAGAIAGCAARFIVGPLDVIKIRFQVQLEPIAKRATGLDPSSLASKYTGLRQALTTIVREEGIKGLWRGTLPGQLLTVPYTAVQFVTLQQVRYFAHQSGISDAMGGKSLSFVSGAMAGAAATIAAYPFDILRTTLAAQGEPKVYHSMMQAARGVVQQHGFRGLYRGLNITLLEIIPYAALQFGLYDTFTAAWSKAHRRRLSAKGRDLQDKDGHSSFERFMCGLCAGTLAKLTTHPLDVAKKRFQVAGLPRDARYGARISQDAVKSLRLCLQQIWQREGIHGFYKGSLPSIIKAAPSAAVTFATYEFVIGYAAMTLTNKDQ